MKYSVQEKENLQTEDEITNLKSAGGVHHAVSGRCAVFWHSTVCSIFAIAFLFWCFSCMNFTDSTAEKEVSSCFFTYNSNETGGAYDDTTDSSDYDYDDDSSGFYDFSSTDSSMYENGFKDELLETSDSIDKDDSGYSISDTTNSSEFSDR